MAFLQKIENVCDTVGGLACLMWLLTMAAPIRAAYKENPENFKHIKAVPEALTRTVEIRDSIQPKAINDFGNKAVEFGGACLLGGTMAYLLRTRKRTNG